MSLCGQRVQRFGELAQHALPRRPQHATLYLLQGVRREEGRHLHQPGRGVLRQPCDQLRAIWSAAELPEGFQDRQVGFAGAIGLDALPPHQPQVRLLDDLRHKGIDHRGLADAGLARDKPHLARAAPRLS